MATIHFSNGNTQEVSQEKAQVIYNVLMGFQKPSSNAQAEFLTKVSNVTLDEEKPHREALGKGYESSKKVGEKLKSNMVK